MTSFSVNWSDYKIFCHTHIDHSPTGRRNPHFMFFGIKYWIEFGFISYMKSSKYSVAVLTQLQCMAMAWGRYSDLELNWVHFNIILHLFWINREKYVPISWQSWARMGSDWQQITKILMPMLGFVASRAKSWSDKREKIELVRELFFSFWKKTKFIFHTTYVSILFQEKLYFHSA